LLVSNLNLIEEKIITHDNHSSPQDSQDLIIYDTYPDQTQEDDALEMGEVLETNSNPYDSQDMADDD